MTFISSIPLPEFPLWNNQEKRVLFSFDMEVTARCNNNCRHCYINLPEHDKDAIKKELSVEELKEMADEAVSLGALWCLMTGGEPLLREDFSAIYLSLKRKGLLLSVFTNATLINEEHIKLFRKYPPRDIEITVYGVTEKTYEAVTRKKGSFKAFMRGLNLLINNGIKVRLKAMALRSNVHELPEIADFCRERSKDYFRFDPFLHLRFDRDERRNQEIKEERLSPEEIITLEKSDRERFRALEKKCDKIPEEVDSRGNHIFRCGAGNGSFNLTYDGFFRLCSSLWHKDCIYDLRKGTLTDAWEKFVPLVRNMKSDSKEFLEKCRRCPIINLCMWCPAHTDLETGNLDMPVDYFCNVACARMDGIRS